MSILISTLAAGFQMPEKIMWYHVAILVGAVVVLGLLIWGLVKYTQRQVRRSHLYTYEKQKEDEKPRVYTYQKQREEEKKREEKRIKARNGK